MVDVLDTKYGEVEIKEVDWHRGMIPLPSGTMIIDDKVVQKIAREYGLDKKLDLVEEFLEYCGINIYSMDFSSSYTEFLHPGSPDLGYNFHVDWIDTEIEDSDIEDFSEDLSPEDKRFLLQKKEDIEGFLDSINDIYDKMLDYVDSYVQSLEEEARYGDSEEGDDELEEYDEPEFDEDTEPDFDEDDESGLDEVYEPELDEGDEPEFDEDDW